MDLAAAGRRRTNKRTPSKGNGHAAATLSRFYFKSETDVRNIILI